MQACGFRDNYEVIVEKNAVVLGVSPNGVASHVKFKSKYQLPFTLLVDAGYKIAKAYGVWAEKSFLGFKLSFVKRSHFIIDPRGKIVAAHYEVGARESVEQALQALGVSRD